MMIALGMIAANTLVEIMIQVTSSQLKFVEPAVEDAKDNAQISSKAEALRNKSALHMLFKMKKY